MKSIRSKLAVSSAALILASSGALAVSKLEVVGPIDDSLYGARVINMNAGRVNVDEGETVKLVLPSKTVYLTFEGRDPQIVDLKTWVPDLNHSMTAYIAPDVRTIEK